MQVQKMSKPTNIKITCPLCEKTTDLIILKKLSKDEFKEELDWFTHNRDDLISPEMTKSVYDSLKGKLKDYENTEYIIGKIKSHKLALFKNCVNSDKTFKVLFYYFMDHKKQLGGFTFRIGQELPYSFEMLNMAEQWAKYCTTLNKESISIVLEMLIGNDCIFTGDIVMLTQVDPDIRGENWKFQCITANSSMKPNDLRTFFNILRDRLENNGEEVRAKVSDTLCIIECLKNDKWYQCVAVAPKGYSVD